ncbi:MAG TPA: N,N-dimethylformamidase beta subunit family domain-containing protein, partial [Candidatus Binatia bacterium]|nr:N,N-dimethylformamidase beta subunit family domain-containing protein [Candidatus Binatia bacterium]
MFPDGLRSMAYCLPQSVRPGDAVALHLSAMTPTVVIEVVRDGAEPVVVWRADDVPARALPIPHDAPEAGCGWPVALVVPVDAAWPSGVYLVRCTPAGADEPDAPTAFFVVRAATPSPDGLLLVLATTTWNAYNDVGGRNFYTGAVALSFERPLAAGMLAKPAGAGERVATVDPGTGPAAFMQYTASHGLAMWHGMAGWAAWERRFLVWAQAAGYRVDVATSVDLETVPGLLVPYRLHLSVGHDEYWSAGMRDVVEAFIAGGGNVAFLSGNTCYWQIRLEGTREVCFKHRFAEDP